METVCRSVEVRPWNNRRKVIYGELKADMGEFLKLAMRKRRTRRSRSMLIPYTCVIEYFSISKSITFMRYIKSRSVLMIFDRHANLKYKYGKKNLWARGYYVDTVRKNEAVIGRWLLMIVMRY